MRLPIGGFLTYWPDRYSYRNNLEDWLKQTRLALARAADAEEPSCVVDDRRGGLHVVPTAALSRVYPDRDAVFVYCPKRRRRTIVWNERLENLALVGVIGLIVAWVLALAKWAPWAFIGQ